ASGWVVHLLGPAGLRVDSAVDQVSDCLHRLFSLPVIVSCGKSVKLADGVADRIDDVINLFPFHDEGHTQLNGVAAIAYVKAFLPALHGNFIRTARRLTGVAFNLQSASHSIIADIRNVTTALEPVQCILEYRAHFLDPINQAVILQDIQGSQCCGAGYRVAGVRITVGQFDRIFRAALLHEGLIDLTLHNHCTHRHSTVGELFGNVHHVRGNPELFSASIGAYSSKTGYDLVKYQQTLMLIADLPQTMQITYRRRQYTRSAR